MKQKTRVFAKMVFQSLPTTGTPSCAGLRCSGELAVRLTRTSLQSHIQRSEIVQHAMSWRFSQVPVTIAAIGPITACSSAAPSISIVLIGCHVPSHEHAETRLSSPPHPGGKCQEPKDRKPPHSGGRPNVPRSFACSAIEKIRTRPPVILAESAVHNSVCSQGASFHIWTVRLAQTA